ncbi:MAG TPA: hypothetical protein EYP78_02405 [Candidatus Omnitrophica bacterium]|nr:hypothetical protein [Candidatus Omnitrophota bacterium]
MADGGGQKAKVIILTIIILIAVGFIVKQLMPKKYVYTRILVDVEAKKIFKKSFVAGHRYEFPVESPYSKGKNAYPAYQCREDGTVFAFVPVIIETPEEVPIDPEATVPRCPTDGSTNVTIPEIPEGEEFITVDQESIEVVRPEIK